MSLVSYGASDDSGDSDDEIQDKAVESKVMSVMSGQISDDEDDYANATPTLSTENCTGVSNNASSSGKDKQLDDLNENFLHNNLPQPKSSTATDASVVLDDTLEDEVKPKASQMADAPKPPPKRAKQPVRITIPKLTPDEDDEPKQKKQKFTPSNQSSGLTSILPPPVHAAKKENNRILLPYSLAKKTQPKPATNVTKTTNSKNAEEIITKRKMSAFQAMTGYESDSDDEDSGSGNFFSLDKDNSSEHHKLSTNLPPCLPSASEMLPDIKDSGQEAGSQSFAPLPKVIVNPDAPLDFKSGTKSSSFYSTLPKISPTTSSYTETQSSSTTTDESQQYSDYNIPYQQYAEYSGGYDQEAENQSQIQNYLQDEQFLRLQGKKERGKEEINIIDANMDDMINNDIEITRSLTEESEYKAHRKKDNMPSSKQKRKHQITYLAFQAKERELELKNSWAQGRASKRQTQSKYGF
ncbi:proline-rich protein PRCC [Patella vulgata]|uniref:proline-rich protein PRCC n=1 Tax=Patella vulgata TaxID=6465 RepID=UPI0024A88D22|nr:proline-rich protein PRCC [Patella vulgata]